MASGGRSLYKTSEETFDFVCTACEKKGKRKEAVKYCVQCSGYCCQSCADVHTVFPTLENHNFMDVSQGKQASGQSSSLPEFPTERCSKHKGKVMDMYCEGHDAVGCSTCFFEDHRSCPDSHFHSIPDMIDTIFKLSDCKQTQSLLKDMIVAMETVSTSKDTQLQTLSKAKKEALDKVTTFQKALEAIVRKAADSSRQEIEAVYKGMEKEIRQDKRNAENIREDLKTTDDKLNQSEGNRAQRFVCTKGAQKKIKEAESEKMKYEIGNKADIQMSFIPDQDLMEYLKGLPGIGQVRNLRKQKDGLYKIKTSTDITIKTSDDSNTCSSGGCCVTHCNQLLVTDANNNKLKRIDIQKMSVVDYCTVESTPCGVCCISKHEVAVACSSGSKIQFVSIQDKMAPTRQIKMSHPCYGIAVHSGKLYVTDNSASLYVYDMTGTQLKIITQDNAGNKLFYMSRHIAFNESGNRMFVGGGDNGLVCFDGLGEYVSTITDSDLQIASGVCVEGRGNIFVVEYFSCNVKQYSEDGEKVGVVVKPGVGLRCPLSVCFHQGMNRMFVTMPISDVVEMYELE